MSGDTATLRTANYRATPGLHVNRTRHHQSHNASGRLTPPGRGVATKAILIDHRETTWLACLTQLRDLEATQLSEGVAIQTTKAIPLGEC